MCTKNRYLLFAINLSATYMIKEYDAEMKYLAENANILFGNLGEFTELQKAYSSGDLNELMHYLLSTPGSGTKIIICTNGAGSVLYSYRLARNNEETVVNVEYAFDAVPSDEIIDTTGCGDAFVAGFFYGFLRKHKIEECIRKGIEVASKKLRNVGGMI